MPTKNKKTKGKRGRGTEADKAKIELRRQRVFEMRAKGLRVAIMAEALGVTPRTIDGDIAALKTDEMEWLNKAREKFPADEYWMKRVNEIEVAIKELWVGLSEQKTDRSTVAKGIIELRNELDKCLRAMGIITTKVDPETLITDTIRIVHEHVNVEQ